MRIPHPAWPVPSAAAGDGRGRAALRLLRPPERDQADRGARSRAFARVRERQPGARLLLVGSLAGAARAASSFPRASSTARTTSPEDELWSLMAACDAIVSLRSPTMGETSGSAIRALSLGKPLVVSDVGWFAELPDDAVLKVPVDEHEEDTLAAALEALADPTVRRAMGAAARALVEREHRRRPRRRGLRRRARGARGRRRPSSEQVAPRGRAGRGRGRARRTTTRRSPRGCARSGLATLGRRPSAGLADRARLRARRPDLGAGWPALVVVSAAIRYALAPPDRRAVDHGRRADLLRAREELRRQRPLPDPRPARPPRTASSTRR